jgi:DnaJ-domain-containing protein 1
MDIRDYSPFFDPDQLSALTAAYEAAWQDVREKALAMDADRAGILKKKLAQLILASACNGQHDPQKLRDIALRGVRAADAALPGPKYEDVRSSV